MLKSQRLPTRNFSWHCYLWGLPQCSSRLQPRIRMAATPAPQRRLHIQLIRIWQTLTHNPQTAAMNCYSQDGRLDQTRQRLFNLWTQTRHTTAWNCIIRKSSPNVTIFSAKNSSLSSIAYICLLVKFLFCLFFCFCFHLLPLWWIKMYITRQIVCQVCLQVVTGDCWFFKELIRTRNSSKPAIRIRIRIFNNPVHHLKACTRYTRSSCYYY